jgi:hypothetical protein
VPINRAYKVFTGIKNGKTGFVFDEKDFAAQYTFITHGSDGKNQTTRVLYGDIDVSCVQLLFFFSFFPSGRSCP